MYVIEDYRVFASILAILFLILILKIIRGIFQLIIWILSGIWYIITGRRIKSNLNNSKDWLSRAQARQEIRFENAAPPILSEAKPLKKTRKEQKNEKKGYSPTGWRFNEETQLWEPPKKLRK